MPKNNTFYVQSNVIINTASGEVIPIITLTQIRDVGTGYPESEVPDLYPGAPKIVQSEHGFRRV